MVTRSPQIVGFARNFHEGLIQMRTPLRDLRHGTRSPLTNYSWEEAAELIDPKPDTFVTDVGTALME